MSEPHSELILCNKYSFDMKLLVVLSLIAISYADKLDRTYLPPRTAATAGGSPGALTAPGIQPGPAFGQGLPSGSGSQQATGFTQTGTSGFNQGPSGSVQPSSSNGFGPSNNRAPSGNGFGFVKAGPGAPSSYDSAFESRIPSTSSGFGSSQPGSNQAGFGQVPTSFDQGFGQGASGPSAAQAYKPERAQASADRNAEILRYDNENNGESYRYSYETSNGIAAEEAGEATNGVRAQGGYSYTGDDGVAYSVTYTADENGYQPQGEHLPTPHPIPEEILKSIEENARAAAAGTQEGAYRPEDYDNESSIAVDAQQYNTGASNFNQPQGQTFGSAQDYQSAQGQAVNRPQSNQYSASQDQYGQRRPSGVSSQYGPESQGLSGQFNGKSSAGLGQTTQGQGQAQGQAAIRPQGNQYSANQDQFAQRRPSGVSGQYGQESQGSLGQFNGKASASLGQTTQGQGQTQGQANGYSYKQPQTAFGSNGLGQGPSTQYRPQTNGQGPTTYSAGSSPTGSESTPSFGNGRSTAPSFNSQAQYQAGSNTPSGNQAGSGRTTNQGQEYPSSFGSPQGSQNRPGNKQFGPAGYSGQGNQYQSNANQNAYGAVNGAGQGNQNAGSSIDQAGQNQFGSKLSAGSNVGLGQNTQSSSQFGRGSQYQQNGNQPAFGANAGPSQGASQVTSGNQAFGPSAGTRDSQPIQAPYQYNRPSQSFDSQPQRPSFNNAGAQAPNGASQGNQRGSEQFGGPRQPPSFSPQEGYKY